MKDKPTYVTMPSLAPLEEYMDLLQGVWERGILTHNGPLVQRLEGEISQKFRLPNFIAVSNGTIAIQMAIRALGLKGEIVTTPFTWVATVSAIKWEGCTPIFADIDKHTLNIDPLEIEKKITDKTVAILPVHVFGNPCDISKIQEIAERYSLPVIYDAAHAIGSTFAGRSLLEYGDISATSLHATKILNTGEGGGCVTNRPDLADKLRRIRFFGHDDGKDVVEDGFNGKLTEIHSALGIANMKYIDDVLGDREKKYKYYKKKLESFKHVRLQKTEFGEKNYSYFPVIFESEELLLKIEKALNQNQIYPRRYFFPSVNTYSNIVEYQDCPISEDISRRILCLPLYYGLGVEQIDTVCKVIWDFCK